MRFSTLYSSPQGCTCYDNQNRQCAPQYWCNECRNNPSNPNCNMRVGNRIVSRYQTQNVGNIYATPTNRFRNAVQLMPLGSPSGGFGMPMGNSGRDAYQNANGSAEEIGGGRQGNPTRGLYAVEINSPTPIGADKLLYNTLVNAMSNQGLPIPMFFSPKLVNKGYRRGNYSYLFEIRDGFRASNFVQESRLQNEAPSVYSFKNNFGKEVAIFYTATFISGYLHSPKGGGGKPIGGGGFNSAVGMGNPTMVAPAFGGTQTPSTLGLNACKKCWKRGCECVRDEKGRYKCGCDVVNPKNTRLREWWNKNFPD